MKKEKIIQKERKLTLIDLFVNQKCNLSCKGCYVDKKFLNDSEYLLKDLFPILNDAIKEGVKIIAIVGKEPLLSLEKVEKILKFVKQKKRSKKFPKIGLVTNGTLLEKVNLNFIKDLDFLDISIDGTMEVHNYFRGKGNFEKSIKGIKKVKQKYPKSNLFIDFTLNKKNKDSLTSLISFLFKLGIRNLVVSPYYPIRKKDELVCTKEEYKEVLNKTINFLNKSKIKNFNVYFKHDYLHYNFAKSKFIDYSKEIKSTKIYSEDNIFLDGIGSLFFIKELKNKNKIYCNISDSLDKRRGFRINSNGDITSCYHMFKDQSYLSLGNIKNISFSKILHSLENKNK